MLHESNIASESDTLTAIMMCHVRGSMSQMFGHSASRLLLEPVNRLIHGRPMLRYSCNRGHEAWHFWLDLAVEESEVWLDVAASIMDETEAIKDFAAQLPSWTSAVPVTTYQSSWKL